MPPFRTSSDVFALNQFIAGRKLESQLIRPEISCLGVNRYDVRGLRRSMMASTAARRRSNSGRSRLSRSSARHPRPRLPNPKLVSRRIARRVARLRSLPSTPPGTAVIVSTAISISEHITFPNDIAVSVTLTDGYTHRTATYSTEDSTVPRIRERVAVTVTMTAAIHTVPPEDEPRQLIRHASVVD